MLPRQKLLFPLIASLMLSAWGPAFAQTMDADEISTEPVDFKEVIVEQIKAFLDGGSLVLTGRYRQEAIQIRYDGGSSSPTRGAFTLHRADSVRELETSPPEPISVEDLRALEFEISLYISRSESARQFKQRIHEAGIAEGSELIRPEPLRSLRILDVKSYQRLHVFLAALKVGPRLELVSTQGKILLSVPETVRHARLVRPLLPIERSHALSALSRPAIERLATAELRRKAMHLRRNIEGIHKREKLQANRRKIARRR